LEAKMISSIGETSKVSMGRVTAGILAAALLVSGFVASSPAQATTSSKPTIAFDGNTLAGTTPKDEVVDRPNDELGAVTNGPLSRVVTTTRPGYTFGGWSFEKGGPAVTQLATAKTSDTFRIIYAVWNTRLKYNLNGADSGAPANFKTQDVYRFGQNLVLPTVGSLAKSNYDFGGWMPAPYSASRITNYIAGSNDVGNPTMYAAWIRNVSFDAGDSTGTVPASMVYTSGGPKLRLPSFTSTALRKAGHNLAGWSTSPSSTTIISNPNSYTPPVAKTILYPVWKVRTTAASPSIAFKAGKSVINSSQRLLLDDLASSIGRATGVNVTVSSLRVRGASKALGTARSTAIVNYLKAAGIEATVTTRNTVATQARPSSSELNRVTIQATWTNPTN
jgi:outer membrane protein OmpA-like peptidoglycan-associated protein